METNAKPQWNWVVISRKPMKVSRSTCKDFGLQVFMDGYVGARVFFSEELAEMFKSMLMANIKMSASYYMRIVSDHEFMYECEEYLANKFNR